MSIYRGRNCRDVYLAALLYDAIDDNNLKAIELLLDRGSDPNLILPLKGISSFHRIIGCDSLDFTMKATCLILQFGGDPNVRSDDGLTPLHIASAWGRAEIVQILLHCGGDPDARDLNHMSPIDYAKKGDYYDCVYHLKLYLPVISLFESNQEGNCHLNLNRILLNNGFAVGEYHFLPEQPINNVCMNIPSTNNSEYIMNWFSKCEIDNKRKISVVSSDNEQNNCKLVQLRKPQRKPKEGSICINQDDISLGSASNKSQQKLSNESGIVVSSNDTNNSQLNKAMIETQGSVDLYQYSDETAKSSGSSHYETCTNSILEKNVFELTEDLSNFDLTNDLPSAITMNESSFIAVSEIYKYEDKDEGIILFERRLVKTPSECGGSIRSGSASSWMSSLPDTFDYDTDTLRMELTSHGFVPGPITNTTKRLYLKKLHHLKKHQKQSIIEMNKQVKQKTYSVELEKSRKNYDMFQDLMFYKSLEETIVKEFSMPDPTRKWREGLNKSSFTYLLLDPRITNNLPCRYESLEPKEVWDIFLSAVFYIGKGKKSRPYSHLYDAVALWKTGQLESDKDKLKYILDIWKNDGGVVCLHVFHNVIPVEAYTREAAMIAAMKLENLTNSKSGDFYGVASTWPQRSKKSLGVYLLYKAMKIFLQDGERQIYPRDID